MISPGWGTSPWGENFGNVGQLFIAEIVATVSISIVGVVVTPAIAIESVTAAVATEASD